MKTLSLFIVVTTSLFAVQEGTFVQYKEAEKEAQANPRDTYQNPLLEDIKAPSQEKELTLQQQIVDYFGTFVTSSPYPGVRATFEGTELMSSLSNVNKDLQLLLELEESMKYMQKKQIPYPLHPRIFMSGQIETTGFIQKDATGHAQSDIDLTDAEIDFLIVVAPWIYGFAAFEYDNSVDASLSQDRIQNSRIHADSLFVTLGDFTYTPWYLTIGQTYIPYGQYTTYNAINNPLTRVLFRTLTRDVALGFYNDTIQFAAYTFKGASHADSGNNVNNYGVNLGYHFKVKKLDAKLAVGAIRNIADSVGMQAVFGDPSNSETLRHVVPGINANGNFSIGNWTLLLEFNQALRAFSCRDTAYSKNGTDFFGPRPKAFDIELAYAFEIIKRPTSIALSYSKSYQALAFNVPKERIVLTWATYVFHGCILSFEFDSNKLYDAPNRVAGNIATGTPYYIAPANLGHRDYLFGIDFLMYF